MTQHGPDSLADLQRGRMVCAEVLLRRLRKTAAHGRRIPAVSDRLRLRLERRSSGAPRRIEFFSPDLYDGRPVRFPRSIFATGWVETWERLIQDAEAAEAATDAPPPAPNLWAAE